MHILLIAPELQDLCEVKTFGALWAWYLAREFRSRGVELRFDRPLHNQLDQEAVIEHYRHLDLTDIDHVLALGTRYWHRLPAKAGRIMMKRCRGAVAQLHDGGVDCPWCDVTFTVRGDDLHADNVQVGWAADGDLICPRQDPRTLRILVDHPNYGSKRRPDRTAKIIEECVALSRNTLWRSYGFEAVELRRIVDGAVEAFGVGAAVAPFTRKAVPFPEICNEYSRTHVFLPTHRESLGYTAIEIAMAGGLVVSPAGYLPEDRLKTIRHLTYRAEQGIAWGKTMRRIDIEASRSAAEPHTWAAAAEQILTYFERF